MVTVMSTDAIQKANAWLPGNPVITSPAIATQNTTEAVTIEPTCASKTSVHNPILVIQATVSGTTGTGTTKLSSLVRSVTLKHSTMGETELDGPALGACGIAAAILDHRVGTPIQLEEISNDPVISGSGTYQGVYALPADMPAGTYSCVINFNAFVCAGFSAVTYGARAAYLVLPQEETSNNALYKMPRAFYRAGISTWTDTSHPDEASAQTVVVGDSTVNGGILNSGVAVRVGSLTNTEIINMVAANTRAINDVNSTIEVVVDQVGEVPSLQGTSPFTLSVITFMYST